MSGSVIPPITDPMGKCWDQPDPANWLIDEAHVVMPECDWKRLARYDHTMPSGVYPGKCWARVESDVAFFLGWYGESQIGPGYCSNNWRRVLLV